MTMGREYCLGLTLLSALACSSETSKGDSGPAAGSDAAQSKPTDAARDMSTPKDVAKKPDLSPDTRIGYLTDPNGYRISSLQIRGRYLYWISGTHQIVKASLDDKTVTSLFTASGKEEQYIAIEDLAVDETHIYYAYAGDHDYDNRGIYKMAIDGTNPTKLAASPNPNVTFPEAIVVSGEDVCYSEASSIKHVKSSGGPVTTMIAERGNPYDKRIMVKQGYLYFTMAVASRDDLYRWPIAQASPEAGDGGALTVDGGSTGALPEKISLIPGNYTIRLGQRIDQGFVYWSVQDTVYRSDGESPAKEVFTAGTLLRPTETGIDNCLFPYEGTMYWGIASRIDKQVMSEAGTGAPFASVRPGDMVADGSTLYVASGADIIRLSL